MSADFTGTLLGHTELERALSGETFNQLETERKREKEITMTHPCNSVRAKRRTELAQTLTSPSENTR